MVSTKNKRDVVVSYFRCFSQCFPRNGYFCANFQKKRSTPDFSLTGFLLPSWFHMLHMSCHVLPAEEIPLEMFALMRIVPGGIDRALVDLCEWWEHRNDKAAAFE